MLCNIVKHHQTPSSFTSSYSGHQPTDPAYSRDQDAHFPAINARLIFRGASQTREREQQDATAVSHHRRTRKWREGREKMKRHRRADRLLDIARAGANRRKRIYVDDNGVTITMIRCVWRLVRAKSPAEILLPRIITARGKRIK